MDKKIKMPKTKTPRSVFVILAILALLGGALLFFFLGFWGIIIEFAILGLATGVYTDTVQGFNAHIALNYFTGEQRVLFQGLNFKLPWEGIQEEKIDLKTDLKEVVTDQTWQSMDALMYAKYIYTIKPDYCEDNLGDDAGEKIILFASFEIDAIKMAGRALFSSLFSDYYRVKPSDELKNKEAIYQAVFGDGTSGGNMVKKFEKEHGVEVTVRLEDSDTDQPTQKARDTVAQANSFAEAVNKLVTGGMGRSEAEKVVKMMNLPGVKETIYTLKIDGVPNVRDITLLPPGILGGGK